MDNLEIMAGLYICKSKNGLTYMSGKSRTGEKYIIFKGKKATDKHPDYILYRDLENKEYKPEPKEEPKEEESPFENW